MRLYNNRKEKAEWVVQQFKPIFNEVNSVLDVGCDKKYLKKHLSDKVNYTGIDIAGNPDIYFDLDKGKKLPFKDNSFDLVVSLDVLEHLENIHFVFDELIRVSSKYIIISLPNPVSEMIAYFLGRKYSKSFEQLKEFGKYMKFYGLPLEKPKDRHRWFFSTEEAIEFVKYRANKNNCTIKKIIYTIDYQKGIKKVLKMILCGFNRKRMLNLFNGATWFLIEKTHLK